MIKQLLSALRNNKGFTIIELIIVLSVTVILSVIGIAASVNYSRAQSLEIATQNVKTILNQARSYAQSQFKPEECENNILERYEFNIDRNNSDYSLSVVCGGSYEIASNKLPNDVKVGSTTKSVDSFIFYILTGGIGVKGEDAQISSPWQIKLYSDEQDEDERYKIINISSSGSIK